MVIRDILGKQDNTIIGVDTAGTEGTVIIDKPSIPFDPGLDHLIKAPIKNNSTGGTGTENGGKQNTPPDNSAYYDMIASQQQQPQYTPSKDKSAGSQAAEGTMYSWDKQGLDAAQNQYNQEALKAKQDALANRQVQEQNALQYQQQADMMKYANNQDAEKVGWTGGYVLDQNRQMEYLKSSIQAQMYGAMELQKYGYDSALAAARLSYDLNQKEFAHKYYQDAVNVAISEAQLTGTYFSAETRDMMSQLSMANQELGLYAEDGKPLSLDKIEEGLKEGKISLTSEQQRALEIKRSITSWYKANEVSDTGIQTLAAWESEQSMAQAWADKQWQMYQAALSSAEHKTTDNANMFIKYDAEGNPIYSGSDVELGNFRNMTAEEIKNYFNTTSTTGKEQVYGYVDSTFGKIITDYLESVKKTDVGGNVTYAINAERLEELIRDNSKAEELKDILDNYSFDMPAGESEVTIKIGKDKNLSVEISNSESIKTPTISQEEIKDSLDKATSGNTGSIGISTILQGEIGNTGEAFSDHVTFNVKKEGNIDGNKADDDFDINFKWDGKTTKNYDLDVDWILGANGAANQFLDERKDLATAQKDWDDAQTYLKENYPDQKEDTFVIYNNDLWYYNVDINKWGYVQKNTGGKKLKEDLETAAKGERPKRWK